MLYWERPSILFSRFGALVRLLSLLLSSFLPWELCTLARCLPVFPREKDSKYSRKDLDKLQERTSLGGRGQGVFPEVMRVPELEGVLAITYLVQSFSVHGHPTEERALHLDQGNSGFLGPASHRQSPLFIRVGKEIPVNYKL